MLSVEEWIDIRELSRRGLSTSAIARQTGRDRKTVRKVIREEAGPRPRASSARGKETKLAPYKEYLLQRVDQGCLNASVLLSEISRLGYSGRITMLRLFLGPIRKELIRKREATERFETGPGKQAQVDWGHFGRIWDPERDRWSKLYAFVFTLGYSRAQYLEFTTSCDMEHFLSCHLGAFASLGIPEQILYDWVKTAILGRGPDGVPIFPGRFLDFALYYGFSPKFCQPYRARTKGKVERGIGYVRQNFWVRVCDQVASKHLELTGLNERARDWVQNVANMRVHGTHGEVVLKRFTEEQPILRSIMARPKYDTGYHSIRRVGRDGRLSYRGKFYQVPLKYALTEVQVAESLEGQITFRSMEGCVMPAELHPGARLSTEGRLWRPPMETPAGTGGSLWLPNPGSGISEGAPPVQVRELAVYEEVARAASAC